MLAEHGPQSCWVQYKVAKERLAEWRVYGEGRSQLQQWDMEERGKEESSRGLGEMNITYFKTLFNAYFVLDTILNA